MRILYIHNINNVAKIYADKLAQQGHVVALYEPDLRGANAVLPVKLAAMPQRLLDMRRIADYLTPEQFDLVHINWASYGILDLFSKIPVVIHCHGTDVRHRLYHPFFRPLLMTILQRASAVLCITPDILQIVRMVRSDTIFSPAPVDTAYFAPYQEQIEHLQRPWTILLFARLDPDKGPEIAIEGIMRFKQRHSGSRVLLLDWGCLKEKYKQRYSNSFEFISLVPPDQVRQLILSADVVVGQFALGALGLSELQAMSCAKPVVCSFRYEGAYPVPPPLYQAITAEEVDEHLECIFQHPEAATTLGQNARAWVTRYHDYQALSYGIENIYYKILKDNSTCAASPVFLKKQL